MSDKTLRFHLSDGRTFEVTLNWLRAQLEPQGLGVVPARDSYVLLALEDASEGDLVAELGGSGWRRELAAAELGRRKQLYAAAFYARCDAERSHTQGECEPEPRPTPPKPR
jgi:hypothetical protein